MITLRWDHPRLCGEHLFRPSGLIRFPGSPPLARGTRSRHDIPQSGRGITPAYAGNTFAMPGAIRSRRDHPCSRREYLDFSPEKVCDQGSPRSRGEHDMSEGIAEMGAESPPLARGTPVYLLKSVHRPGITPARAGNTSGRGIPFLRLWDHPRLRGEHNREQMEAERQAGSPPPARGTLI